jgi:spore maturation protein CgeB
LFLERDRPWYAAHRDLPKPPFGHTELYDSVAELKSRFAPSIRKADAVIVGSYVPEGVAVGEWVTQTARGVRAFYDIDTPVTMAKLAQGDFEYLTPGLIPRFDRYLSFTGGPLLERIEEELGSPCARALYCSVDPALYYPEKTTPKWELGYLGTYSPDRQPTVERLLLRTASKRPDAGFVIAGPLYPDTSKWPENVAHIAHLSPGEHRGFYNAQRFTLNVTRAAMIEAGYSPSVRLFEAAACGVPLISDPWAGLETIFRPGREILIARNTADVVEILREMPEADRMVLGQRARERVMAAHTAAHRAAELESILTLQEALS